MMNKLVAVLLLLLMMVLRRPTDAWIVGPPSPAATGGTKNGVSRRVSSWSPLGVGGMFGGAQSGGTSNNKNLPRDVKEAITRAKEATQEALKNRVSRMDIEFPVGAKFKVETQSKGKRGSSSDSGTPTLGDLNRSDRELARLYVDMFAPVGLDRLAVVFRDATLAEAAKKKWKSDPTARCRVTSVSRKKSAATGKAGKKKGFAAKMAAEMADEGEESTTGRFQLADDTEVAIFVGPGPKELVAVERICQERGMDTLVILLNARLSTIQNFGTAVAADLFTKEFEPVFHLAAYQPQDAAPNCLLHRAYPGDWMLARQPKVGAPKTFLVTKDRPTADEAAIAFNELKISDVEKGVEDMVSNVAGWFK